MPAGVEYSSTSIRLGLSVVSDPNAGLIDQETKAQPAIYTSGDLTIEFALFDQFQNIVDLSNITYVEADFIDSPETGNILAQATLTAAQLTTLIPLQGWLNGTQDQGEIAFSSSQLAAIVCDKVWLVIHALTSTGDHLIWGSGWVVVKPSGISNVVNMPLSPVPEVIPLGAVYTIPAGVVIIFPTSPKILGQLVCSPPSGNLPAGSFKIAAT